jgi:IS5 family transposase
MLGTTIINGFLNEALRERFPDLLALAVRVRLQDHRQRGPKVYALHAPEVECIGKGKARASYEFGCKVSVATSASKPKGGQFVLHARHCPVVLSTATLWGQWSPHWKRWTGIETRRIHVFKGYRGHNHAQRFASGPAARCAGLPRRSDARCTAAPPSSRSLGI